VTENFSAYSVLDHRHVPEILMVSGIEEAELSFTAQLLPIHRGILETIYFRARGLASAEELLNIYIRKYQKEPFVRLYPLEPCPTSTAWSEPIFATSAFGSMLLPDAPWW